MRARSSWWWGAVVWVALAGACGDDDDDAGRDTGARDAATDGGGGGDLDLADPVATVPGRGLPGGTLEVVVTARNSGSGAWGRDAVRLVYSGDDGITDADLGLDADVAPGAMGSFTGTLRLPTEHGRFDLSWQAAAGGASFGPMIVSTTEVTCSDGSFCNGIERLSAGVCVPGNPPCDDRQDCTRDSCDEALGRCDHTLSAGCAMCRPDCMPECTGRQCGPDGCGGSCGDCPMGEACAAAVGTCRAPGQEGTCANPLPLVAAGTALIGQHSITGDTSDSLQEVVPTCNSTSTAVELVYTFTTTERLGIDARSSGYDTVLHLRREDPATSGNDCLDDTPEATVGCSDDSSPPGDYGSRIAIALDPGTYYLIVDGFDDTQFGPFALSVRFLAGGCVPACDGLWCGGDDGCGGDCGSCEDGYACDEGHCVLDPCVPQCEGRTCGMDGCGGSCGTCPMDRLCVPATGTCESFPECDRDHPSCRPPCASGEYCGTDCECHPVDGPMPDLVVDSSRLHDEVLLDSINISPDSCALAERCVGGMGMRRLLRFSVEAINQGDATLSVPQPDQRPDLFSWSSCRGTYQFSGFAAYSLLDSSGEVVLTGHKEAYCMEDTQQVMLGPDVPCSKVYDCSNQSIQPGWSDLYGNALDCQWLDITDTPPGDYVLRVELNPARMFEERTFENNRAEVPISIP